jgi:hypothetical protein
VSLLRGGETFDVSARGDETSWKLVWRRRGSGNGEVVRGTLSVAQINGRERRESWSSGPPVRTARDSRERADSSSGSGS